MSGPEPRGRVLLVGAGPGDPDLITVRGAQALARADAVVHDSLATAALLELAPAEALRIDVGKRGHGPPTRSQDEINALLVSLAREGRTVVRLKGGDPFVYGRGGEEASVCAAAGIPFEVVPGVTSAVAVAAYAGIPVTDRRHSASFAVVTGHRDATRPWTSIRWDRLATAVDTLVVLMGMRNLEKIVETLVANGRAPETPAAVICDGTTRGQRVLEAPLGQLAARARDAGLGAPAVVVVGDVVRLRRELAWYETRPLFGWRVLVTRAVEQAADLVAALEDAGAEAVVLPMIRAAPSAATSDLDAALGRLDAYDALLFTSANGVHFFAVRLRARGVAPGAVGLPVVCVGAATAQAARRAGLPEPWTPPEGEGGAEGLLAAVAERFPPAGRRFLFPRAEAGRDVLPEGLRHAGAEVDVVAVYRTVPADVDAAALRRMLVLGELTALTFTSPSTVQRFLACLDPPALAAARGICVAAIGRTTAGGLRAAGLEPAVVPARAGVRELVEALAAHAASLRAQGPGKGEER